MLKFRRMNAGDYDGAYQLWLKTPGMGLNTADDSHEGITAYLHRNPATCFVAEEEGEIIGAILAGHDGRRGFIYHVAVSVDRRRSGVGTRLVEHAMEALEREGIRKVALVVFRRNETGNAFWERFGFSERTDLVYRNKNITELTRVDP